MSVSAVESSGTSLILIEGGLTAIGIAIAFCWPQFGTHRYTWLLWLKRTFAVFARQRGLAVVAVGISDVLLRLAILPWFPIPHPVIPDDFSFLLAADTFASGRLTNPVPAMWKHFESIHITMQPSYMSMYFPAQGLALAAGKDLFGNAWYGELFTTAVMCAAICWMLQGWIPPTWALLGGLLAILRLGLFSYWINTYVGGGSLIALGGALVLGAFPRLLRSMQNRDSILLAIGIVILATSRPYEGLLLSLPVVFVLGYRLLFKNKHPNHFQVLRCFAIPLLLIIGAGSFMAYYDYRAFGNPLTPPYAIDRATYATAPYWIWQAPRPEPPYRHNAMRDFYNTNELNDFKKIRSFYGFPIQTLAKFVVTLEFFAGFALLPPLLMVHRSLKDRRIRFVFLCLSVGAFGLLFEAFLLPYYLAPYTAALYLIGLQCMRHLNQWKPAGQPVGGTMVSIIVMLCVALSLLDLSVKPFHLRLTVGPGSTWNCECLGVPQPGAERAMLQSALERLPGQQLVIVRYSKYHHPMSEWVYNAPDIDGSKVIWARDMNPGDNQELLNYYKDRQVWLVEPDFTPARLSQYPMPAQLAPALHQMSFLQK